MIAVHVMQVTVVQVINVPVMDDGRMAAAWSVLMRVVGMVLLGTRAHESSLLSRLVEGPRESYLSAACSSALGTSSRTWWSDSA